MTKEIVHEIEGAVSEQIDEPFVPVVGKEQAVR
jgi:hypothetical protein